MTFINYFLLWHVDKHKLRREEQREREDGSIDMNDHDIRREKEKNDDCQPEKPFVIS